MADHLIIQIRDAVASALGVAAIGEVFTSRPPEHVLQDAELPALWLAIGSEDVSEDDMSGEIEVVDHQLTIVCLVKQSGDFEAATANLARDVRHVIAANRTAGGAKWINYVGAGAPQSDGTGETPRARWDLAFSVRYATLASAVDTEF